MVLLTYRLRPPGVVSAIGPLASPGHLRVLRSSKLAAGLGKPMLDARASRTRAARSLCSPLPLRPSEVVELVIAQPSMPSRFLLSRLRPFRSVRRSSWISLTACSTSLRSLKNSVRTPSPKPCGQFSSRQGRKTATSKATAAPMPAVAAAVMTSGCTIAPQEGGPIAPAFLRELKTAPAPRKLHAAAWNDGLNQASLDRSEWLVLWRDALLGSLGESYGESEERTSSRKLWCEAQLAP